MFWSESENISQEKYLLKIYSDISQPDSVLINLPQSFSFYSGLKNHFYKRK